MTAGRTQTYLSYAILILFTGLAVLPFVAIVLLSFKDLSDLNAGVFALPKVWRWENYVEASTA
jgi:raffinose/stachyose/melibiose transport system permease protein